MKIVRLELVFADSRFEDIKRMATSIDESDWRQLLEGIASSAIHQRLRQFAGGTYGQKEENREEANGNEGIRQPSSETHQSTQGRSGSTDSEA
jgi:hypothetical protein